MKLTDTFDAFLRDVVNLNQTRIDTLKGRVDSIAAAIRALDDYSDIVIDILPQGSWSHKTIIRPPGGSGGFDADVVVFVKPRSDWGPPDYIERLYKAFKDHGTYKDKVSRKTRCVVLTYAGEFSIDLVPCIRKEGLLWDTTEWVLNRVSGKPEQTNPGGFSAWFQKQNKCVGNNQLIKVVRLMKYLRDSKSTFSAKSILLTTLLGQQISWGDEWGDGSEFSDLPTSLRTIIKRLDGYLQAHETLPEVSNPSLEDERFTRHWDQDKYDNFRSCIHRYANWVEDAYVEKDRDESIIKWRRIFGDEFARSSSIAKDAAVSPGWGSEDLSHVEPLPWAIVSTGFQGTLEIDTTLHSSREGEYLGSYRSGGPALQAGTWLHFSARHSFSRDVVIKWQVVNTGPAARADGGLRGKFCHTGPDAWETTKYKGRHWVECFAVDMRHRRCFGRSGSYYVNVA